MAQHVPKPEMMHVAVAVVLAVTAAAQTATATGSTSATLGSHAFTVQCDGNNVSLYSMNFPLGTVLQAIADCTGASVDISPQLASTPVAAKLGPAGAREVLTALLASVDYVLAGPLNKPDDVTQIIVKARAPHPAVTTVTSSVGQNTARADGNDASPMQSGSRQGRLPSGLTPEEATMTPQELYANFERARQKQIDASPK